nr:ABC transporter F family member 4-like [Ipomoea batatas]
MERRGKGRHYAYRGRKARSDYKCYEQSDEDYKVCKNEVFDESEDEYSSFVGDTSEESLGEYEDKEEEKEMEEMDSRVVKKSSDLEYTISEEEREQVREASKFCRGLTASWRRPAFLKNSPEEKTQRLQKKRSLRKGKEKVEEVKTESGKQICGICLSEEGKKTIRGTLNCCSHYFCFACIMEWSKVESRCPLCKQRFVTISKPAKSSAGFDLRPVVIQVLERDQVYEPSEEELRGYLDPYENVICTECQQGGDDALMLLCDICDSPSHTYCVGLGHEVPEGNWYCEGCRSSSPGFQNPQNSNRTPESRTVNNFSVRLPPIANMRDTFDLNEIYVPDTPLAQEVHCTPSPRDSQAASGSVASTVSDRRRIHRRINQFLSNRTRQVDSRIRDNG